MRTTILFLLAGVCAGCSSTCPGHVIDGEFTDLGGDCDEWQDVTPLRGRFGDLYLDVEDTSVVVLNDWHLRDDAPAEDEMYNLFCLTTDAGMFEIRVFGDHRVEAWRDGVEFNGVTGASGFGSSPLTERPHTMFEFRLEAVNRSPLATPDTGGMPRQVTMYEKDPAPGPMGFASLPPRVRLSTSGTCFEGSAPAAQNNLVTEPTLFDFELSPEGVVGARVRRGPALLGASTGRARVGETVTLYGAQLGETEGEVWVDDTRAEIIEWRADRCSFVVPDLPGDRRVMARANGIGSHVVPLTIDEAVTMEDPVDPPVDPPCEPVCGECGDDGCGGSCGECDDEGFVCHDVTRTCVPEDLI